MFNIKNNTKDKRLVMSYNKIVIEKRLRKFLQEDCNFWDVSAICIPEDAKVTAKIIAKSRGYLSGLH